MELLLVALLLLVVGVDVVVSHRRFARIEALLGPDVVVGPGAGGDPEPLPSMTRTQKRERLERAARKKAQESRAAR